MWNERTKSLILAYVNKQKRYAIFIIHTEPCIWINATEKAKLR